jgi:hypothetical protein
VRKVTYLLISTGAAEVLMFLAAILTVLVVMEIFKWIDRQRHVVI